MAVPAAAATAAAVRLHDALQQAVQRLEGRLLLCSVGVAPLPPGPPSSGSPSAVEGARTEHGPRVTRRCVAPRHSLARQRAPQGCSGAAARPCLGSSCDGAATRSAAEPDAEVLHCLWVAQGESAQVEAQEHERRARDGAPGAACRLRRWQEGKEGWWGGANESAAVAGRAPHLDRGQRPLLRLPLSALLRLPPRAREALLEEAAQERESRRAGVEDEGRAQAQEGLREAAAGDER